MSIEAMKKAEPIGYITAAMLAEKDALLRQALEALENSETTVPYEGFGMRQREAIRAHLAITEAIRNHLGVKND